MTSKWIILPLLATVAAAVAGGCTDSGEVATPAAAATTAQRSSGARPVSSIPTGPVPESLKSRMPPGPSISADAAKRRASSEPGTGRSPETEPRKID